MNSQNFSVPDYIKRVNRPHFVSLEPEHRICDKHGRYEASRTKIGDTKIVESSCAQCDEESQKARAARELKETRAEYVRALTSRSGIPLRHRDKRFDGYTATSSAQRSAMEIAKRYASALAARDESPGASLLFVGPPGTGKTHLAAAVAVDVLNGYQAVRYTTCSELTRRLRATYGDDAKESESAVHEELTSCRLLILDELAATSLSEHERRNLFEIVDTRYRELLPMVLISNLPLNELAGIVGERIVDRLREMATTVAFAWQSHRGTTRPRSVRAVDAAA